MRTRFQDKVAIVTGGARGIGEGCARVLAEEGAQVVLADIREKEAQQVCASIQEAGGRCTFVATDVLKPDSVQACVERVRERFGGLHVLVNNAGTHFPHTIDELSPERWDFLLDLNLKSVFLFCKATLPELRKSRGAIVNMSSMRALSGQPQAVAYCASKAGILGLTMALARDEAPNGVRVNAICPSSVDTPLMNEWIERQQDPQAVRQACEAAQPMGRMATIEEIGRIVAFLASDDAAFVTGTHIVADGGARLGY